MQRLLGEGSFQTEANNNETTRLGNHRFSIQLNRIFDPSQDLRLKVKGFFSDNQNLRIGDSRSFLGEDILNASSQLNDGEQRLLNTEASLTYRKKLSKKGRFLIAKADWAGRNQTGGLDLESNIEFLQAPVDTILQRQESDSDQWQFGGQLNYVEPLGKNKYLNVKIAHESQQNNSDWLFFNQATEDIWERNSRLIQSLSPEF